jgi:tetratricopeptide (TPR) repeat protein
MVDLTLRGQFEQARQEATEGDLSVALATCRRILETFPRHIQSYAVLGQVCLQVGERQMAADLFRRVLGANPEHALAYASLGAIYEERGLLEEATWQYQRAFELSPRNTAIREALQRLYAEHSLQAAQRVTMTRGGLARTYMRGHLWAKAIGELRQILDQEPHRLELRVALAESLWHDGNLSDAEAVCRGILEELPNCLKANLILGQLWLNTERDAEAREMLQRAQTLDPENATAQSLFGSRSPLPPKMVRLPLRDEDVKPLDLPYLYEDDQGIARGLTIDGEARVTPTDRPKPLPLTEPVAPAPPRDAAPAPAILPASPPEGRQTVLARQREYLELHPDNRQARLTLARLYRDIGDMSHALEQYAHLMGDAENLDDLVTELRSLNTLRPGHMGLLGLLVIAQEKADRRRQP